MCCFSGDEPVHVAGTRIFGRLSRFGEQALAYTMHVETRSDVAMVLPVPLREDGRFRFIDLSAYGDLFEDLEKLFPRPVAAQRGGGSLLDDGDDDLGLAVERVGAFDASFVPTRKDFARLDARFRIKDDAWKALPQYADWAFAVFKLRPGAVDVQPMGFQWETRFTDRVFFPTVHIHDGKVHKEAAFDHVLYAQLPLGRKPDPGWWRSDELATSSVDLTRTSRFVAPRRVFRRELQGRLKNSDTFLEATEEAG